MVFITACGSSGKNNNAAPSTGPSAAPSATADNTPVELTLWMNWKKGSAYTGVYYDRVHEFMDKNPNIKLTVEEIPYGDYNVRLQTAAAGNQLPDMMQFISGGPLLELVARSGAIQPLDSNFVNEWKNKSIPAAMLAQFEVDGKQYGIPAESNYGSMIFYNKKMLADAGYNEFPTTFAKFLALIEALKAKNITPISLGNKNGDVLTNSFLSVISDRIIGPQSLKKVASKEIKVTSPEFVSALTKIKELAGAKAFNKDANTIDEIEATNRFLKGDAAITISGSWLISQIIKGKTNGLDVGTAIFPLIDGGKGKLTDLSGVTNQAVVMKANLSDKKKKAVESFIRFMFNDELFAKLTASSFPVTASNTPIPDSADPAFKGMITLTKKLETISPTFTNVMPPAVTTAMNNALQGLIMDAKDPAKAAEEVQKLLN